MFCWWHGVVKLDLQIKIEKIPSAYIFISFPWPEYRNKHVHNFRACNECCFRWVYFGRSFRSAYTFQYYFFSSFLFFIFVFFTTSKKVYAFAIYTFYSNNTTGSHYLANKFSTRRFPCRKDCVHAIRGVLFYAQFSVYLTHRSGIN